MAFLHQCWGLLNIGLMIGLFVISYRNFQLFVERFGSLASGLLFLLTMSMCSSSGKKSTASEHSSFVTTVSLPTPFDYSRFYTVKLIKLPTCQLTQRITLSPRNSPDSLEISSYVSLTGFIAGVQWSPIATSARIHADRRIHYSTIGTFDWRLLNITVYRQLQQFKGSIPVATR